MRKQIQTFIICTGDTEHIMDKFSREKLKEHYSMLFKSSVGAYNNYIESGVVTGKEWLADRRNSCEVCMENMRAGTLPLNAKFPSGHFFPPSGQLCRCILQPVVDESDNTPMPKGYEIQSKWKGNNLTMTVIKTKQK